MSFKIKYFNDILKLNYSMKLFTFSNIIFKSYILMKLKIFYLLKL